MTATELLTAAKTADIRLEAHGHRLVFDAPRGARTPELRGELARQKPTLLAVLQRLEAMRRHGVDLAGNGPRPPCAVARLNCGGPGHCFSCGDALGHPEAYGRCTPCDVASDLFYAEMRAQQSEWGR